MCPPRCNYTRRPRNNSAATVEQRRQRHLAWQFFGPRLYTECFGLLTVPVCLNISMKRLIFVIVSAALLGWIVASLVPLRTAKDPWDVATAVGTVLAVSVALYFGIKAQLQSVLDAREMARLTASRAKAIIVRQREAIGKAHELLKVQGNGIEPDEVELVKAMNYLFNVPPYIEFETLLRLIPLPKRVAHKLARVQGQCESLHYDMSSKLPVWNSVSSDERKHHARVWLLSVMDAAQDIDVAFRVCVNAFHDTPPTRSLNWNE